MEIESLPYLSSNGKRRSYFPLHLIFGPYSKFELIVNDDKKQKKRSKRKNEGIQYPDKRTG